MRFAANEDSHEAPRIRPPRVGVSGCRSNPGPTSTADAATAEPTPLRSQTHIVAVGWATSRSKAMVRPHRTQIPNTPVRSRSAASSISASRRRASVSWLATRARSNPTVAPSGSCSAARFACAEASTTAWCSAASASARAAVRARLGDEKSPDGGPLPVRHRRHLPGNAGRPWRTCSWCSAGTCPHPPADTCKVEFPRLLDSRDPIILRAEWRSDRPPAAG